MGDADSWNRESEPKPPTHQCTRCKWRGPSWDADLQWQDAAGKVFDEPQLICPYCESPVALMPEGQTQAGAGGEDIEDLVVALDDLRVAFEQRDNPMPAGDGSSEPEPKPKRKRKKS